MPHFEVLKFMSLYIQEIFSDKRPQCGVPPHVSLLTKKYVCHQSDGVESGVGGYIKTNSHWIRLAS